MSGDVVIVRRQSSVTYVRGSSSSPIIQNTQAPALVIQREGIPGTPGASGGGATYQHTQSTPSTLWTVNHNLGAYPSSVSVIFSTGKEVEADIQHITVNQLTVSFVAPQTGIVRVSP